MLGFSALSTTPVSALDTNTYVVVPNPAGDYGKGRDPRKPYIIDGNRVYLNEGELQRALAAFQKQPDPVPQEPEKPVEDAVPYSAQANELAAWMELQAEQARMQAEIQQKLAIQAAVEQKILAQWMEERRRDEEEALLVLL